MEDSCALVPVMHMGIDFIQFVVLLFILVKLQTHDENFVQRMSDIIKNLKDKR